MEDAFTLVEPPPEKLDTRYDTVAEYRVSDEFLRKLSPDRAGVIKELSEELYERVTEVDPRSATKMMWRRSMYGRDAIWGDVRYGITYEPEGILRISWGAVSRDYDPVFFQKIIDAVLHVFYKFAFPKRTEREAMSKIARSTGMPADLTMDVMKKYFGGRSRTGGRRKTKKYRTRRSKRFHL